MPFLSTSNEYFYAFAYQSLGWLITKNILALIKYHLRICLGMTLKLRKSFRFASLTNFCCFRFALDSVIETHDPYQLFSPNKVTIG